MKIQHVPLAHAGHRLWEAQRDGWMDGVWSSQHVRPGQRERGSQTLGHASRRKSSFNEASRNLQRPLRQEGLEWRSRRCCRYVTSGSENTREDSGCTREELRGCESARMDLAECGGKQMVGQLTQLSGSGWKWAWRDELWGGLVTD